MFAAKTKVRSKEPGLIKIVSEWHSGQHSSAWERLWQRIFDEALRPAVESYAQSETDLPDSMVKRADTSAGVTISNTFKRSSGGAR